MILRQVVLSTKISRPASECMCVGGGAGGEVEVKGPDENIL